MDNSDPDSRATYLAGLRLLARRELSEAQLRQRLARRGHAATHVDDAIARLKAERALDDGRTAEAIARTAIAVRGRGRARAARDIARAGIAAATTERALDRAFADVDADDQLRAALEKRLRGRPTISGLQEMQRLYRHLIGQGFDADRVLPLLRRRLARDSGGPDADD